MPTQSLKMMLLRFLLLAWWVSPFDELRCEESPSTQKAPTAAELQNYVDKVEQAPTALQTMQAYRAILKQADPDDLRRLRSGAHDGIALQIAWQEVVNRTLEKHEPQIGQTGIRLIGRDLSRFVGFAEGRLRVTVPDWWEKVVLSARAARRTDLLTDFVVAKHAPYHKTALGPYAPVDTAVEEHGKDVVLRIAKDSVVIPDDISKQLVRDDELNFQSLTALLRPRHWYLVLFNSWGESRSAPVLYCIERESGKLLWESVVSVNHEVMVYRGVFRSGERPGVHAITIVWQSDRVMLFGADNSSAYVHGFSAADGSHLFRFSTDYVLWPASSKNSEVR